jgi:aspartyl-tRNA(Asn)/glutamyl-tRNA(Gln) amidotransferase subunit C
MILNNESLRKMAHLARIEIKPEDETALLADMQQILTWIEKLNEIDTSSIEPLTHMSSERNTWRADNPLNTLTTEKALGQAPHHTNDHYVVPKVIE